MLPLSASLWDLAPDLQEEFSGNVSVFFSPIFLRLFAHQSQSRLQPNTLLQFSHSCFAAHFFQKTFPACCKSMFFTSFGQANLISMLLSPSNIKVCQKSDLIPRSRVSHITAPAGPLTCLHSLNFSNLFHPSCSFLVVPFSRPDSFCQFWVATVESSSSFSTPYASMNKDREAVFFSRCCCHLSLHFFYLTVGAIPTPCTLQVLADTMPARNNILTPTFMQFFWKALFFMIIESLHFFHFRSLAPFALVLKSTPIVSTMSLHLR